MAVQRLSKSVVEKLKAGTKDLLVWDETLSGFGVRVKPSGVRSYLVQYRNRRTGCSKRATIGQHGPLLTFDQAKREARSILADALRGGDLATARQAEREAPRMRDLCHDYIERHAKPNKRPRSVRDDQTMIDKIILPAFGGRRVEEVSRREIEDLHLKSKDRPYRANRVLALLSKMFSLAVQWDWRADNPVKGVKRFPEEKRYRWLSEAELQRLWQALEAHPNRRAANAVKLQVLTGARLGEVLTARRDAFDLDRGVWTKPSHQTKQHRTEHVPLSASALDLVASVDRGLPDGEIWLFPGNKPGEPLKDIKRFWASVVETAGITDYRRHDNRHTYASHLVSAVLSLEVVGRLLGHTSPMTTMRYAHLADDPLRQATDAFSSKLTGPVGEEEPAEKHD